MLCEVCTVLQALMVLDDAEFPDEPLDELTVDIDHPKPRGLGKLHVSHLLQMILQDAQTRLFFKAQSLIQAEIRYFIPKPEDLAYPDLLVGSFVLLAVMGGKMLTDYCSCKKTYISV